MMLSSTINKIAVITILLFIGCGIGSSNVWADDVQNAFRLSSEEQYENYPQPGPGYVTDLAHVLSNKEKEQIQVWLWQVESRKGVEIAVVTLPSINDYPGTDNGSIERFAAGLFNAYGIGNKPANNGILLLVSVNDRKARIELGAYYGHSYDKKSEKIIQQDIIPQFKTGHYSQGITNGVKAIMSEFTGTRPITLWDYLIWGSAVIGLVLLAANLFKNGKTGWAWFVVGMTVMLIIWIIKVILEIMVHLPTSSSDDWAPGGFGGGFGGGSSGGGGATGSW